MEKAVALFQNDRSMNLPKPARNQAFLPSLSFLLGLHFSQTFLSLVAVTQQGCEQAFAAAIALSQQDASAWHFSQAFLSLCAATQQGCWQSLPPALALTQQLSAIAPLVLSRKAAAQTVTVNVLMNFIMIIWSGAERLTWQPHPRKPFTATQPRVRGIDSSGIYRPQS
jgi:hypothetical protein